MLQVYENPGISVRIRSESLSGFRRSPHIFGELGNLTGQGNAHLGLGIVRRLTGDYPAAADALETARGMFRDTGSLDSEAEVLNEMGALHSVGGDLDRAMACHRQALALAREAGSVREEACALAGLGRCALAGGDTAGAEASLRQAWLVFQRIGASEAADVAARLAVLRTSQPARDDFGLAPADN